MPDERWDPETKPRWLIVRELDGKREIVARESTYGDAFARIESYRDVAGTFEIVDRDEDSDQLD